MKRFLNTYDKEICFTDLEKAKDFFDNAIDGLEDDADFLEYTNRITKADSLEGLADVLNEYKDTFGNGTEFFVDGEDDVYIVVHEKGDDAFYMFESTDIDQAKKEASDHAYILERDKGKGEIVLVNKADYEEGNYNLIKF